MLFRNSVESSGNANCVDMDGTVIEPCFALTSNYRKVNVGEEVEDEDISEVLNSIELSKLTEAIL